MNTSWYKYLVYLSLVFLAIALYNANYLRVPHIFSYFYITLSFFFLFLGFVATAVSWKKILKKLDYHVTFHVCLAGVGTSIFGKYIPGKIWMIMGQAAYVADNDRQSLRTLSLISLNAQLIALWVGLLLGMIGLFLLDGFYLWGWLIFFIWLGFTVVFFCRPAQKISEKLIKKIGRASCRERV